jgi:hypothetical protein
MLVTLATFNNPLEAHIVAGRLKSDGINVIINHQSIGNIPEISGQFLDGIILQVHEKDEELALFYLEGGLI